MNLMTSFVVVLLLEAQFLLEKNRLHGFIKPQSLNFPKFLAWPVA